MGDFLNTGRRVNLAGQADIPMRVGDLGDAMIGTRYQELAMRGLVFSFSRAAITLPVNAATLASLMGLYNPPGSGKFLEIIAVEGHYVVATTVVNALGLYYSNGTNASGATFTTQLQSAVENARVGEGVPSIARAYSAVTHVGTPALLDIVGGWGAVTDGGATPIRKVWAQESPLLIPPGTLLALAMTTAAATGSGFTGVIKWAETPYVAA